MHIPVFSVVKIILGLLILVMGGPIVKIHIVKKSYT